MKFGKKSVAVCLLVVALFSVTPACQAGDPIEKLGRGVANIAFSPMELLMKPWDVAKEQGEVSGITYGVFKGLAFTVARVVVGAVDVVTFLIPLPGCSEDPLTSDWGYGPMMEPAWVVDSDHNWGGFFYREDSIVQPY